MFHFPARRGISECVETKQLQATRTEYLFSKQVDGLATGTLKIYEYVTRYFVEFLDGQEISPTTIRGFVFSLKEKYNPTTVNIYVRSLRTYINWLVANEYLNSNPMEGIKTPRAPSKFFNVLSVEEVVAMVKVAKKKPRDAALLLFLLDTGVRASELCNLKLEDLSLANCSAKVYGKGGKERVVFFSPPTGKALAKWLSVRPDTPFENALFIGVRGDALTRHGLANVINRLSNKAGIERRIAPHTLRHTFATMYVRGGGDPHSLQQALGHTTLYMAMRYVDFVGRDLAEAHQRYSPVLQLEKLRSGR